MVKVAGPRYWLLLILLGFNCISGQIKTDFQVREFAVDGYKTNPISFATTNAVYIHVYEQKLQHL